MDPQTTFFTTLVDEWIRCGVTDAVVAPGNRSTLMAAILEDEPRIRTHVMIDERSASFFALGLGQATGRPAIVWTTSGTATTELHAAVVEAHQARVPLLICTADRPPELQHARDWQTIDQSYLYQGVTRWAYNPGVATPETAHIWRSIAVRAVAETMYHPVGPGPVHLDLPIREPWKYQAGELPPARADGAGWHRYHTGVQRAPDDVVEALAIPGRKGVIVAGKGALDPEVVHRCAEALGWPVLADVRSGCRIDRPTTVSASDALLRSESFTQAHQPEVVLRLGTPPMSKFTAPWIKAAGADEWLVDGFDDWAGSISDAAHIVQADPNELCRAIAEHVSKAAGAPAADWLSSWQRAGEAAERVIAGATCGGEITEPGVARALLASLPTGSNLFASTSMPVRDIEWYGQPQEGVKVFANRGASGMDGVTSTAAGIAFGSGDPTVMLVGDLSLLHDLNALWVVRGASSSVNLTIVVVDNNGGGIFSTFPQLDEIDRPTFERVVATPQHVDIPAVAEALDAKVERVTTMSELMPAVQRGIDSGGLRIVYVQTNRVANAALLKKMHADIRMAIES